MNFNESKEFNRCQMSINNKSDIKPKAFSLYGTNDTNDPYTLTDRWEVIYSMTINNIDTTKDYWNILFELGKTYKYRSVILQFDRTDAAKTDGYVKLNQFRLLLK